MSHSWSWPWLLALSISVATLSLALSFSVRGLARRYGAVAKPRDDRWHKQPTALFGGVAIYLAFLCGLIVLAPGHSKIVLVLLGASAMFMLGIVDDLVQLRPYVKLVGQVVVASLLVHYGLRLPWTEFDALNELIAIFWLVGITNSINLLDNMDGLAGGISAIAALFVAISFYLNGQTLEMSISLVLIAAILGFLALNFNPATLFMGDCGSMFLGMCLASLCLLSDYGRTRNLIAVLSTPVLILLIPIFDTCLVTLTRKVRGQPISQGGRDHTSHRLVALGMSERRAVLMLYLFALVSGGLTLFTRWFAPDLSLLVVPTFALAVIILGFYLGKVSVVRGAQRSSNMFALIADFGHKRRVFEVLLDVCLIVIAYYGAFVLRWDGSVPLDQRIIFFETLPLLLAVELAGLLIGGVYSGLWHYTGVEDLIKIGRSTILSGVCSFVAILAAYGFSGPSRGALALNTILLLLLVAGSRISFRVIRSLVLAQRSAPVREGNKVAIYGAGDSGELLIRELLSSGDYDFVPVAFVDDDARKVGKKLHGVQIYPVEELPQLVANHGVREVVVSSRKVPTNRIEKVQALGLKLKRLSIKIS